MRTVPLGSEGLTVSEEGLGCMSMSSTYGPADEPLGLATLRRAVELGVTLFDTAESYGSGHNETLVGRGLAPYRDQVVLATKVGFVFDDNHDLVVSGGRPIVDGRPEHIVAAIEGSLGRLGVEYIDLVYLHRIDPEVPVEDTVAAMAGLIDAGKIGHIGLSEASAETIRRAHGTHPVTAVQTEYSLFERGVEANGVLAAVQELGIGFVPYSPLGRGFLTGTLDTATLHASDFRNDDPRLNGENLARNRGLLDAITAIADAKGVKPAQLALAWTMARGGVPIPGTRRIKYLEENVAAADLDLTPAEMKQLDEAAPVGAASGDRYSPANMDLLTR
ncbi:aldo/keto reductase [Streptomyces sp. NPDC001292]|uniref:aldo/keto reductase n=1 Tax=Streptomyces sp. NPDC001292 TaxID=3364558 RepID=UPI0036CC1D08